MHPNLSVTPESRLSAPGPSSSASASPTTPRLMPPCAVSRTSAARRLQTSSGCSSTGPYTRAGQRGGPSISRPLRQYRSSGPTGAGDCVSALRSRASRSHGADHGGADRAGGDRHPRRARCARRARKRGAGRVRRRGEDRGARPARAARLLLPWGRAQREHGPRALLRDRSLRLSRPPGHSDLGARDYCRLGRTRRSASFPYCRTDRAQMNALGEKKKGLAKTRIPIAVVPAERLAKPEWIRVRAASAGSRFYEIKQILRENNLHTVCEEASCPNIGECFGKGTATFMILGDLCTRRCPFCDVAHGRPLPPDPEEP